MAEKSVVVTNIARLVTMEPGKGRDGPLGVVEKAAVRIRDGRIVWTGPESALPAVQSREEVIDAEGGVVLPGLVDCHTHLVHGGWRQHEFNLRSQGRGYQEIAAAGGGILSTVRSTRAATADELLSQAIARADEAVAHGTTALEIKTGYGLDLETESKTIDVIRMMGERHAIGIRGTSLAAHAVPPEFKDRRGNYVQQVIEEILPRAAESGVVSACDVFVEEGAFTPDEARAIARAGRRLGLALHLHVDQFHDGGGAALAAELSALSADHLDHASDAGIVAMRDAGVVGVILPGASFFAGRGHYPDARKMIDLGTTVAVATDYNPGTNPSLDLWLAATIAVTQMGLSCEEALLAITRHAARALALADAGAVAAGKRADLVVLDAPDEFFPLYRYGTNCVAKTIIAGEIAFDRHRRGET